MSPRYRDPVTSEAGRWLRYPLGGFYPTLDADFDAVSIVDLKDSALRYGNVDLCCSSIGIASDTSHPVTDWNFGDAYPDPNPKVRMADRARHRQREAARQQLAWEEQQRQKQLDKERVADAQWQQEEEAWLAKMRCRPTRDEVDKAQILYYIKDIGLRDTRQIAAYLNSDHSYVFALCLELVATRRLTAINEG